MDVDPTRVPSYEVKPESLGLMTGKLQEITIEVLLAIHDSAGPLQFALLEKYPDTLPIPLRDDLEYYDGAVFFLLHIARTMEEAGYTSVINRDQHLLVNATNGLNDWWIDEWGWGENGARDYDTVIEVFDGVNAACYPHLLPAGEEKIPVTTSSPEVQRIIDFYDYVLTEMPEEQRPAVAKLLISINLYQGLTLYQEKGFREYMGLQGLDFDGRDIGDAELQMLDRMRVEKGGFMFVYLWPYFPKVSDCIAIPDKPPTLTEAIARFLEGESLYSKTPLGRHLLKVGGMVQLMDDSCDREEDWDRGIVSPENVGPAYAARANESWNEMVDRVLGKLADLMLVENPEAQVMVQAAALAVAGLTRYRESEYGDRRLGTGTIRTS